MPPLFSTQPQSTHWGLLFPYMSEHGLKVASASSDGAEPDTTLGYLGSYDVRTGVIIYIGDLSDEERAMALTHEVFHSMIRPHSLDADPYIPNSVPSEERIVNRASMLVCHHFGLGHYSVVMGARSVLYLDEQTPSELATASHLAESLISELEWATGTWAG